MSNFMIVNFMHCEIFRTDANPLITLLQDLNAKPIFKFQHRISSNVSSFDLYPPAFMYNNEKKMFMISK